jgi:probable rRNA maturation factor
VNVFVADEQSEPVDVASLRDLATSVLVAERCPADSEVSLMLVGDEEMAGYNRKFMERTGPTDVISLPIEQLAPGRPPASDPHGPPPMLGDVIVAPGYVRRQAENLGVDFDDEVALMVVHGLLHLLGYDHADESDAEQMEARERHLLAAAGRKRR